MNKGPIFVAGLERSGTSLIYALLASHPNIAMTRRTNMWTYFYDQYGDLGQPENFDRCLNMMMVYKRLVKLKPDSDRIRSEFWQGEPTYARLFAIFEEHFAERKGKPRWGDKSLNTERYAEEIFDGYPGARILHMIRDPRDRYASVIARWKTRRGGEAAGVAMWLSSMRLAKENKQRFPNQYMLVRYETLVTQPIETMQEICAFIDEEFTTDMLSMEGAKSFRDIGSNSSYGQGEPGVISTSSIGRFRQVLTARQISFIQRQADQQMSEFDYQVDRIELSPLERLLFIFIDWPYNQARIKFWQVRNRIRNKTGRRLPDYRIVSKTGL